MANSDREYPSKRQRRSRDVEDDAPRTSDRRVRKRSAERHEPRRSRDRVRGSRQHGDDDEDDYRTPRRRSQERDRRRSRSPRRRSREDKDGKCRRPRHGADDVLDTRIKPEAASSNSPQKKNVSFRRSAAPLPSQAASFQTQGGGPEAAPEKERPNYKPTGILAAWSNQIKRSDGTTVVLKYHEPAEARKASSRDRWKMFVFKGPSPENDGGDDDGAVLDTVDLNGRSCWLIGRERSVVDLPTDHPSVSKQHAVVQFRYIEKVDEYGDKTGKVKPFLIDLESAHGTFLNGKKIEDRRYVEIRPKDIVRFAKSEREYVFMLDKD